MKTKKKIKTYEIKITGGGTKEEILNALKELTDSLDNSDFEGEYEDGILMSEINEEEN